MKLSSVLSTIFFAAFVVAGSKEETKHQIAKRQINAHDDGCNGGFREQCLKGVLGIAEGCCDDCGIGCPFGR